MEGLGMVLDQELLLLCPVSSPGWAGKGEVRHTLLVQGPWSRLFSQDGR